MIDRYSRPQMSEIFSPENKFQVQLKIELLACEALNELGVIPKEELEKIKNKARLDLKRLEEIEAVVHHETVALLTTVAENMGEESRFLHLGMTSSDVLDTSLAVLMKDAADLIISDLEKLREVIIDKAREYKYTPMIGRTHGIHAEPITFGLKLLVWLSETDRNLERMRRAKEIISYGKISGAVGTYAHLDPYIEKYVCEKLGLKPALISTQIEQRDRHAEYLMILSLIASSLEKFATEIRNLQRTEIREVEEPFRKGQKGSSAMPHKRNPVRTEQICGLARVVRANSLAAMENIPLWNERDISHSSVERIIVPDSCILIDYMLNSFTVILTDLMVYPENMRRNLELTGGLIFSEKILLELVKAGLKREEAYSLVQRNALLAWEEGRDFRKLIEEDEQIRGYLGGNKIEECFAEDYPLKKVDVIFSRFGL